MCLLGGPGNDIPLRGSQRHSGHPFSSNFKVMVSFRLRSPHGLDLTHINVWIDGPKLLTVLVLLASVCMMLIGG